jgi:hypothetical protein
MVEFRSLTPARTIVRCNRKAVSIAMRTVLKRTVVKEKP